MNKNKKSLYVCGRCALEAPTCCRLGPEQANGAGGGDCFPLSRKEHGRIASAVAKAGGKGRDSGALLLKESAASAVDHPTGKEGWCVDEPNSPLFVKAMCRLFPKDQARVKELFPKGGAHLRLSLAADGGCVFLSGQGCTLPRRARPWFCRIFPFWEVAGTLQCFHAEDCLAVRESGANFMALMGAFDSTPEDIMERYQNLRRDWGVDEQ